ncbi:2-C-methyl-D-erythritol 4-phosphate cytidylyltransferase [Thermovibrio guaymasensis]|uniref:2-C-methyl-D-erythritol 4-phosphate cytidylyltransferase n=1 Tax=Thermovibrio guaymasensis TaxID=240167 RepID=A0A420W6F2_9BACT|nr:2-C-methyl-D-erythritol 4-phosphate cytidylyltransferase [Thermovibrio guaymasensis]RKQ61682.1 2-C-methyl-D-erythritol 4-phosphate cytidylyltransferase [Thermovibrio guaymasensis]
MRVAVVPAAGIGRRFGGKKQFFKIGGREILEYPLKVLNKSDLIDGIILVLPQEDLKRGEELKEKFPKLLRVIPGGKERQSSVYRGLLAAEEFSPKEVIVHDGVRPVIELSTISDMVIALSDYQSDGIVLGVKPKETVKEVESPLEPGDFIVKRTLNRDKLILVQTPQLFKFRVLLECHKRAEKEDFFATDDAALLERYGYTVISIPGDYRNLKITTPEDLKVAELFLKEIGAIPD